MFELKPPSDDKQYIPTVGEWSHDKYYFIKGYIDAFTTAMKNKAWSGLHYIDLFAGAGIVRLESSKNLEWGSPLIAAQAPYPFTRLHLCEKNKRNYIALKARVEQIRPDSQILQGDANKKIRDVLISGYYKALYATAGDNSMANLKSFQVIELPEGYC